MMRIIVVGLLIALTIFVMGCQDDEVGWDEVMLDEFEQITCIVLLDGFSGRQLVCTDEQCLGTVRDWLCGVNIIGQVAMEQYAGYEYWLDLYNGDEQIARMVFRGDKVDINGVRYQMSVDMKSRLAQLAMVLDECGN